ncbi:interleukin-12 receptor subunit beta-2 [Pangasianodon hypophthalmus]|uniref:interleukin-12 receptor subunit beta-2 n=1 Tax=Pangasianodon hypophthalmus TaxID=310915 RepID=UPI000F0032DA|nr:interleukin-12 receptor subunit beta-2 [Pangasianodon hypophthalmus]
MFPEGNVWSTYMFLLLLTTGVPAEKICSVHSNHEVHMGSSFQIYCIFKKECSRLIYQDEVSLNYSSLNSTVVIISIVNITRTTTFTCKCRNEPEPCGTDIVPGYPPAVPQNLTCVQEGESGKVNCTWKTEWETHIKTTSHLWLQGAPPVRYESVAVHDGTHSAIFPVSATQRDFSVWVHANNSLGSANSTVLSFTLNEIVKPLSPKIMKVECSSRQCQLYPDNARNIQMVEIRYEAKQDSWNTVSFNNTHLTTSWTITSLNPYSTYTFEVKWKPGPTRGLWSEWTRIEGTTDEEAPVTMLDAWYIEEPTKTVSKSFQLFWRELNKSEARGKILQYVVTVTEQGISNRTVLGNTVNVSCFSCRVSISAMNSKGLSPARQIQLQPIGLLPYKVSHTLVNDHSVALSWPRPVSADPVTEFLVEWFPEGRTQPPQWIRVERHLNTAHITGLQPAVCYEGAVVYLYSSGTKKAIFKKISTWQTAPQQSPETSIVVKSETVQVKWSEIPPKKRGGCLEHYIIYLKDSADKIQNYNVTHPQREFTISGLIPGQTYTLWVSAWTTAGESPIENMHPFIPKHPTLDEKALALLISVGSAVFLTCLCLLCLCQFSSVHRRLSGCCHCLMPSIVPDPANSKWAKECASEKGEMKLQLHLSDSSMSEEEPYTVEVEEFPQEKLPEETISTEETLHSVNLQAESAPYQHNITSSYLKSFSNESSSSDATHASRSTDITVDYISTHGVMSGGEEEDEDDGDEEHEAFDFFPCPKSPFLEPLISIGGKLTLDSVKIDCSDFLDCA